MAVISQFTDFALHFGTVTPIGNETPIDIGDLYIWQNGPSSALFIATALTTSDWQQVAAGDFVALSALTWSLIPATAAALVIKETGGSDMQTFNTAANTVTFGEAMLANLHIGVRDYAEDILVPTFIVRTDHAGGNTEETFTLPARTGGWMLVDAFVRSAAGTGGNYTLKDAAGGNAMTNAIVPGNANVITRATSIIVAQETVGSGAVPEWDGAASSPASACYSIWVGL